MIGCGRESSGASSAYPRRLRFTPKDPSYLGVVDRHADSMIRAVMMDRLIALFSSGEAVGSGQAGGHSADELHLASAALLVEAANMDGHFDEAERLTIRALLKSRFDLDDGVAAELVEEGCRASATSTQLYGFTRMINDSLEPEERATILEMLWEVAYADGEVHPYESNLVRRVAGLLHVTDRDSGAARKRVVQRLQAGGTPTR